MHTFSREISQWYTSSSSFTIVVWPPLAASWTQLLPLYRRKTLTAWLWPTQAESDHVPNVCTIEQWARLLFALYTQYICAHVACIRHYTCSCSNGTHNFLPKSKAMNSQHPSSWGQIHTDQWGVSSLSCGPSVLPCEGRSDLCHSAHTSSPRAEASDIWLYQGHHCRLPSEGLCLNSITKKDNTSVTGILYYQLSAEHSQTVWRKGLHHGPPGFLEYHYGH